MASFLYWQEYLTYLGVFFGALFLLVIIAAILDNFFPNNKFSKVIEKALDWIFKNINVV